MVTSFATYSVFQVYTPLESNPSHWCCHTLMFELQKARITVTIYCHFHVFILYLYFCLKFINVENPNQETVNIEATVKKNKPTLLVIEPIYYIVKLK